MSRTVAPIAGESGPRVTKLGSLHLCLINVGRSVKSDGNIAPVSKMGSNRVVVPDFHDDVKYRVESIHHPKRVTFYI